MSKLVLIDGQSTLYRIYNGISDTANTEGVHTNAVFGFLYAVLQIIEQEQPDKFMVFQEKETPTTPASFREQARLVKDVMENAGVFLVQTSQETGAYIEQIRQSAEDEYVIVTANPLLLYVVDDRTKVILLPQNNSQDKFVLCDADKIKNDFGISPQQLADVYAIAGEKASSMTGANGIGFYTALSLIQEYQSVQGLFAALDMVEKDWILHALVDAREQIEQNLELFRKREVLPEIQDTKTVLQQNTIEQMQAAMTAINSGLSNRNEKKQKKISLNYHVVSVTQEKDILHVFQMAAEQKKCAFRFVHDKAANHFGASQTGQLFLQLEEKKDIDALFICMDDKQVYLLEAGDMTAKEIILKAFRSLLWEQGVLGICFHEKDHYGELISSELDQRMSARQLMNQVFDCEIAAYLLNPLVNDYSITGLSKEYLCFETASWSELFGKADQSTVYAERKQEWIDFFAKETVLLWKLHACLEKELAKTEMLSLFQDLEMPLSYVLFDMEREGILVKPDELKVYADKLTVRIQELEQMIYQEAGEIFNINSPKQLGEILFEKMGIPGGKKTKTGYSTAADVLEKLAPDYPFVEDILEYRGLAKLKSTYAEGLASYIREDNRIHTHFNQTITATGRLSSTEPNLQNIPMRMELGRQIRKAFVPAEGCIFMDADYSQIELRVLAHMSGDKQLIEAYQMDEDIHRITASKVFHTPFEEVTDLQRRNAKAVNFGIVYGISSFGLSQGLSISPKEAKIYIDEYFKTYPGIKDFLEQTVENTKQNGYCTSMFGRRRPVPELKSGNHNQKAFGERIAMNSPIQGTAADIIKYAMLHVYDALKAEGLRSRLILQIHDELLIETRLDEVEKVREIMEREMKQVCDMAVALEIDLHTGTDWYEAK